MINDAIVNGLLEDIYRNGRIEPRSADDLPIAAASASQVNVVIRALADARAAGLRIPPHRVRFVSEVGYVRGQSERFADGSCVLVVNVAECRSHEQIRSTTLHEAQHLADIAAGRLDLMSLWEIEHRAIVFAARMMARG